MDSVTPSSAGAPRGHLALVRDRVDASPAEPLLPRIAAGDERAVRECVSRYGALVWSLARRWSPDASDAEDAAQEIYIDLWRTASRYDPARMTEAGWVAMLARRRLIDRSRRRERLPALEPIADDLDVADDRTPDLDQRWRVEQARAVLDALPPAQRRMLELSLLEGRTHDEIARETATPLGTVKSHIRRGLQRARDLLAARSRADEESAE
ncbi:MAG: sigma-70 family RNA polymerase sigma factor [Gemmatimonadaceae bacterium]|nr:sigma-70 family RNA polymerase sigma factor [Gemmatimonadaceae bacterium]